MSKYVKYSVVSKGKRCIEVVKKQDLTFGANTYINSREPIEYAAIFY